MTTTSKKRVEKGLEEGRKKLGRDDPEQSRRFIEIAKELEADDAAASAADAVMGRMAAKPHKPHKEKEPDR